VTTATSSSPPPRTASAPITLVGSPKAVLHDPKFKASDTDCPSGQTGYGLWLQGASYWNSGVHGHDVQEGHCPGRGPARDDRRVTVHDIGYEGVHFRKSSAYGVIENSNVYNTG